MWLPIYDRGANVRFVSRPDDLNRPDAPWGEPRVVYLQHASDPIAWWSPDLLFAEPDWLKEPRGYDVSGRTQWIPVVTFLQVAADMAVATEIAAVNTCATTVGVYHSAGSVGRSTWAK